MKDDILKQLFLSQMMLLKQKRILLYKDNIIKRRLVNNNSINSFNINYKQLFYVQEILNLFSIYNINMNQLNNNQFISIIYKYHWLYILNKVKLDENSLIFYVFDIRIDVEIKNNGLYHFSNKYLKYIDLYIKLLNLNYSHIVKLMKFIIGNNRMIWNHDYVCPLCNIILKGIKHINEHLINDCIFIIINMVPIQSDLLAEQKLCINTCNVLQRLKICSNIVYVLDTFDIDL